jgi:hypothetical protein
VFEDRVLRRTFGRKRDEVTGEWKKIQNEEVNDLYSSPNTTRVTKLRTLIWEEHEGRMGIGEVHTGFWWGKMKKDTIWKALA